MYNCAKCTLQGCSTGEPAKGLPVCPNKTRQVQEEAENLYLEEENKKIAYNAALVEAQGYGTMTRVEEIISFAKKCGYHKIGLAFCIGLVKEAREFQNILKQHDLEVVSVLCKNGGLKKEFIGIGDENKIKGTCDEIMCNPIGQALLLNEQRTDFNVILGLCVGHDTLVMKYLEAPMTILAVKDRVTGHNPLAAIYLAQGYYKKKLYGD
jgi:uncharacterized metal-binding protein